MPMGGGEPADGWEHGSYGMVEVIEVDGGDIVRRMVVIPVQAEA